MTLRLPGEVQTSANLTYSTYTASLTGTYTYWTVGNFVGTDVNTGKVVYGTTNTNYTITCHGHSGRGGGCTYTYTTDNGTIVVFFTQADATTTRIVCAPPIISPGSSTNCTATVNDSVNASSLPEGNVSFGGAYGATTGFSGGGTCTLAAGTCEVSYTAPDDQLGTVPITATFEGTPDYYSSSSRTSIYVTTSVGGGGGDPFSTVALIETGLANGTEWSATLGGSPVNSTGSSLSFQVQNGTYAFTVGPQVGYQAAPAAGNVTVAGSDVNVSISFTPITYNVTPVGYPVVFTASGLPSGTSWSVELNGAIVRSTNLTMSFNETDGAYAYLVGPVPGFSAVQTSGSIYVDGAQVTVGVAFNETNTTRDRSNSSSGLPGAPRPTPGPYLWEGGIAAAGVAAIGAVILLRRGRSPPE